ncbi:transporter substrate-binding domain-containing protein [Rubellimicrobium aerolatum]|uniref:Transporter substrate-binding domain-containing protein n=1 Tax=Rubellimicrobium aerolatum TaxID=490979 RepID=A0ABW0S8I0_9RHOB|nr:transporter substrate-binding domain-containing protein [Rubellimicrobium aerolatum]MBP1804205.1 polar amino acid transport system substrate-binding protein [Rubellimicrobium aerolatum]
MSGPILFGLLRRGLPAALALLPLPALAQGMSVDEAKAEGTVRIGIQADNQPWGFLDSTGNQDGFDADMGRAFAEHLGVEVEFVPMAVANRIPALTTGVVDVLFASVGMTPERAQSIQYSRPYASNILYVVGPVGTEMDDVADLAGLSVGVPNSAPMDTILTAEAPEGTDILRFDDDAANIQALVSGQVQAVGANQFYMQRVEAAAPGAFENKFEIGQLYQGAATRLGEADWNAELNAFLEAYLGSEEYKASYNGWLEMDPPAYPDAVEGVPFTVQQ